MMAAEPVGGQVAPVVLVVEDDAALVSMLQDVIPPAGYTMVHAADGLAGLACIQAGGVDLVLLDLALPQLSGLALCQAVRAAAHTDDVYLPIIMVTAFASVADRQAGFTAGADDYIPKPFDLQELLARVAVWMRVRRHAQAAHATREALREAEHRQLRAQLDAIHLTAREMAHRLNNDLTLATGFLELLQYQRPDLTASQRALLADARAGLTRAVDTVERLHHVVRVTTRATPSGPALDLDRSTVSTPSGDAS
jgi:DNA-binding response OmpR family regulator